jgi:hypothetical protein
MGKLAERNLGPIIWLVNSIVVAELRVQRSQTRFVEVVNAWIDFNRGIGTIREQMIAGLAERATLDQVLAELI